MQGIKSHVFPEITGNFYVSDLLLNKKPAVTSQFTVKRKAYCLGPLNLGKIRAMLQVNTQSQLLAAEPGKWGFPKTPSQENKSSHIAGGLCLHNHRREGKWGEHMARISPSLCSSETRMQTTIITNNSQGRKALGRCHHQCNVLLPPLQWVPCSFSCLQFLGTWAFLDAFHSRRCFCFLQDVFPLHCLMLPCLYHGEQRVNPF